MEDISGLWSVSLGMSCIYFIICVPLLSISLDTYHAFKAQVRTCGGSVCFLKWKASAITGAKENTD